jgi:hypothetical protein
VTLPGRRALAATLLLAACGPTLTYRGPERPQRQQALVTLKEATLPFIDEHSYDEDTSESYAFLPGRHVLTVARPKGGSSIPVAVAVPLVLVAPVAVTAGAVLAAGAVAASRGTPPPKGMALVCPRFKAGHRYMVLSRVNKAKTAWHPAVWDVTVRAWVEGACAPNQTEEVEDEDLAW